MGTETEPEGKPESSSGKAAADVAVAEREADGPIVRPGKSERILRTAVRIVLELGRRSSETFKAIVNTEKQRHGGSGKKESAAGQEGNNNPPSVVVTSLPCPYCQRPIQISISPAKGAKF